jgi:DNA-binding XRE family transcriptional regulator
MKKKCLYGVDNKLDYYVKKLQAKYNDMGLHISLRQIQEEVGSYCGVTWHNIDSIRLGKSIPALQVAMRVADYFDVSVEEMFMIHSKPTANVV